MDWRKRRGMSASNQGAASVGASDEYVNCDIRSVVESGGGVPPDRVVARRITNDCDEGEIMESVMESAAHLSDGEAEM